MGQVRVLIVDDAVVVRRMLSDIISSDTDLIVVGTAANGKIALNKLPQVTPDVVILDHSTCPTYVYMALKMMNIPLVNQWSRSEYAGKLL